MVSFKFKATKKASKLLRKVSETTTIEQSNDFYGVEEGMSEEGEK